MGGRDQEVFYSFGRVKVSREVVVCWMGVARSEVLDRYIVAEGCRVDGGGTGKVDRRAE